MKPWQYESAESLRDEVLLAANHICADCGGSAETAHHTTYRYGVICPPDCLVALCWDCHRRRHGRDEWDDDDDEWG
jgi:5-methylcytosine-specific restriction endonuclease McrA